MPARPAGQGLGGRGRQRVVGGRDVGEQPGRVQRQRPELEGQVGGLGAPAGHRVAAGDDHQPRAPAGLRRDPAEDARAGRVEQVGVLDEQQGRGVPVRRQQVDDQLVHRLGAELLVEGADQALLVGQVEVEHRPEQRQPRGEVRGQPEHQLAHPPGGHGPVPHPGDAERARQQAPRRAVRREQAAAVGGRGEHQDVLGAGDQLADQPRLADPGLADDLHDAAGPAVPGRSAEPVERGGEQGELLLAADHHGRGRRRVAVLGGPDHDRVTGRATPLRVSGRAGLEVEDPVRVLEHARPAPAPRRARPAPRAGRPGSPRSP